MKYALITGASSGLGKEFAKLLACEGFSLILVARREDRLIELKEEIQKNNKNNKADNKVNIIIKKYDLSNIESCYQLYKECINYPIQLLINNAGFGKAGRFLEINLSDEVEMLQTNVVSLHILTKLFAKSMNIGTILNVASMAGFMPDPLMAAYGATKSYVIQFSQAVNYELKKENKKVKVSVLCPGPIETEFQEVANVKKQKGLGFLGKIYENQILRPDSCAKIAWTGLKSGKDVIFIKRTDKILYYITKILPVSLLIPIQYRIQSKKCK